MVSAPYSARGEEKLRLIFGQLAALRFRLNSLAFQQGIFVGLALLISATAIVVLAAFTLYPLAFLLIGAVAALACVAGLMLAGRHVWRMHRSAEAVAVLADVRADLKGRLLTLVALRQQTERSPLWPYLVEDATLRREDFTPARIESRRISRTLYALLGAVIVAALVARIPSHHRHPIALAKAGQTAPLTLNLRDLTIEPSDRPVQNGARLSGDPKTMRKLAQMMADADRKERNKDLLSKMMRSAHDLAGNLQDKITGRQPPPLDIRLADNGDSGSNSAPPPAAESNHDHDSPVSNGPRAGDSGNPAQVDQPPARGAQETQPGGNPGSMAMQASPNTPTEAQPQNGTDSHQLADQQPGGNDDAGGASHGSGSDPQGLYGQPDTDTQGDGSFQIAIDARPGSSAHAGDRAFPPKVNAPLNTEQHPDEPIGRTTVPAEDRSTIKRIFER
ncbi:MAG TPA: hypothetical protein VMD75_16350 [Candidatus Binataceae bacterium]|nr:hypothetical protein [Candidatus Binataceae bacterium]